jgi:hypothetical protein
MEVSADMYRHNTSDPAFTQGVGTSILSQLAPAQIVEPFPNASKTPRLKGKRKGRKARTTRPWHKQRFVVVNGRRQPMRRSLSDQEFRLLLGDRDCPAADARARHLRRPFTVYVVLRPVEVDDLAPEKRKRYWDACLHRLHEALKRLGVASWTYAAVRESCPIADDGSGEHLNALVHVPEPAIEAFISFVHRSWGAESDAQTIRSASKRLPDGRYGSVLLYAAKNMQPKHSYKRNVRRERGGPIMGKRAWVSRDLTPEAFAEWKRQNRA